MTALAQALADAANRHPQRPAVVAGDVILTYEALVDITEEVAAGLAERGVRAGQLVALSLPSSVEYVVSYLAAARLGAAATGINPRFTPVERNAVTARAAPDFVIGTDGLTPSETGGATVITIDAPTAQSGHRLLGELRGSGRAPAREPTDDNQVETVVFTSGTTGTPKGAVFTSRQIRAITEADTGGRSGHGGPQLVATGLSHVGFMTKLAGTLQAGSTMHVLSRWRAAEALRVISDERIPIVGGVAAQVSLLLGLADFDDHDLSAVQGLVIGGGPSPAALIVEARARFGAPYSVRYSSTESGGLGTLTPFDAPDSETLYTVGRPRPGTDVSVLDPIEGKAMTAGQVGRVCIKGSSVMDRYWQDPAATEATLSDGWLYTDDLGSIGEDGCLRISGRMSETYIRGGYNVHPQEVEAVLLEHPDVAEVAVSPRSSDVMGQVGVAVVVPRPGREAPSLRDLRDFAGERLAAYKLPEEAMVVEALPLTGMDKLDRRALGRITGSDGPPEVT